MKPLLPVVLLALASLAVAQEPPKPANPNFRAKLLLVKSDWSKAPSADRLTTVLRAAFKDVSVPQSLLDKLPASGPRILFGPQTAAYYAPQHYAELEAWLKNWKLLEEVIELEPQAVAVDAAASVPGLALVRPYDFLALPVLPAAASQPFVARQAEHRWQISQQPNGAWELVRRLVVSEKLRGELVFRDIGLLDRCRVVVQAADPGGIILVNALPGPTSMLRQGANERGFEPVFVLGSIEPKVIPKQGPGALPLPYQVQVLSVYHEPSFTWPNDISSMFGSGSRGDGPRSNSSRVTVGDGPAATPPPTGANPAIAENPGSASASEIRQFSLKHARADSIHQVLTTFFGGTETVRLIPTPDSNQIIVRGPSARLDEISKLIALLDAPPSRPGELAKARSFLQQLQQQNQLPALQPAAAATSNLAEQYQAAEQEAQAAAQQWRTLTAKAGDVQTSAEIAAAQQKLQAAVAKAFETRQQLQQTELLEMQRRIYGLAGTIEAREKIKDQIIDRRVQELLNPALQWPVAPAAASLPATAPSSGPKYPMTQPRYGEAPQYTPTNSPSGKSSSQPAGVAIASALANGGRPLSEVVQEFNRENMARFQTENVPPLTDDEVVASIRWRALKPRPWTFHDYQLETLLEIAETRIVPSHVELYLIPGTRSEPPRVSKNTIELLLRSEGSVFRALLREQYLATNRVPPSSAPNPKSNTVLPDGLPLDAAVHLFNAQGANDSIGKDQPVLSADEVLGALRSWIRKRAELPVTNAEFRELEKIVETGQLPPKAELEVLTSFQPNDELLFDAWSVRLVMPRGKDGGTYAYVIRDRWLRVKKLKERQIAWGPVAKNGLQVGLWIDPPSEVLTKGQQIVPHFYFRNAGEKDTSISLPRLMTHSYYSALQVTDDKGEKIEMEQDEGPAGPVGWTQSGFPAGAEQEITGLPIVVGQVKRAPGVETVICAEPGQQCRLRFVVDNYLEPEAKETLTTGEMRFALAKE